MPTRAVINRLLKDGPVSDNNYYLFHEAVHYYFKESFSYIEKKFLIIIKFTGYNVRNVIFRKKKILKGKAVSITENLTKKRITEMKVARETYGFKNVWSQDGKILYTDANDRNKIKVFYD